jgi:hypothetical protein
MPSLVLVLSALLAVMAAGAWAVVIYSALRVLSMVPAGRRREALGLLGRWQLLDVGRIAGDRVAPHANRYLKAMMFFLGIVACYVAIAAVTYINTQMGPPAP